VDTATELIAGAIQGAVGFYDHTIDLQRSGQDMQSVVVFTRTPGLVELASTKAPDSFRSMADAAGRRLGVTGFGASTYFLTRYLAQRAGVKPNAYTTVAIGSERAFIDAVTHGTVDAGMIEEPTATTLLDAHAARVLVDMRSVAASDAALGGPYAGACLYMHVKWVATHHDEAQKLARALVRALQFLSTHTPAQIVAVVPEQFTGSDQSAYLRALTMALPTFTTDGKMPAGAPATVLAVLTTVNRNIDPRHIDLARTYTNAFVERVSGAGPSTHSHLQP
jgi:NitT/TauT family transport system substrate-binding protein